MCPNRGRTHLQFTNDEAMVRILMPRRQIQLKYAALAEI